MGAKSSKVVITPENAETASNLPGEVVAQLKSIGENGSGDAAPPIESKAEPNGECHAADTTTEIIPTGDSIVESKSSEKKPGPINWIQKKISFKKTKAPKKSVTEEKPAESTEGTEPVAAEEKREEGVSAVTDDAQVQSEEVPTVDQGTTISETPEVEPVVEITPSTEGVQKSICEEEFVEEPEQGVEGENGAGPHGESAEESQTDLDLAAKIANLGIDAVESIAHGVEVHLNGDAMVAAAES